MCPAGTKGAAADTRSRSAASAEVTTSRAVELEATNLLEQKGGVVDPLESDKVVVKGGDGEGSETRKVREMETEMKDLMSELTEIKAKGGIEKEQD